MPEPSTSATFSIQSRIPQIIEMLNRKLVGQREAIERTIAACLAGGNVLLEDVPGTGKTTLAASLATMLGLSFRRVQGTPDLLPGDVVGTTLYSPKTEQFSFHRGPIFTNVLLMDEINRATPRTQSALLEAMAERQISADGDTYPLPTPFFVLATANPLESQGVFQLPEAQLDRFLVQIKLGYIAFDDEVVMVQQSLSAEQTGELSALCTPEEVIQAQAEVKRVTVSDLMVRYIVSLCRETRNHDQVLLGASPRAILALTQYAQALAYVSGRDYVIPDDIKRAFHPVMVHRLQWNIDWMEVDGRHQVMEDILSSVAVPHERVLDVTSQ